MPKTPPVVVITGASSGIGRATALRFAADGAHLVLASRRGQALRDLVAECEHLGAEALAVPTDVTDYAAVMRLGDVALARFSRIDVWINNASVGFFSPFLDVPVEDFRRVLDVNIMGYVYGARVALDVMTGQGSGTLINVASILGEVATPFFSAYSMSKAAIRSLGVSLREELGLQNSRISVVTVLPPTIDTPFYRQAANYTGREVRALPPVYPPELVAKALVRAVRHPKAEIVVGAAGKALVREHRRHPLPVEAQLARMVDTLQLPHATSAPDTAGTLYVAADSSDASVTGGWAGSARFGARRLLAWALLLGGGTAIVRRLLRD